MLNRETILSYLNETIVSENGKALKEEDTLSKSEIDSFGYALFWIAIEEQYGKCFPHDEVSTLDYKALTIQAIIDRIIDAQNNNTDL